MGTAKKNLDLLHKAVISIAGDAERGNWISEDILRSVVESRDQNWSWK